MTYYVSGFNVFKQWPNEFSLIDAFTKIDLTHLHNDSYKLYKINWSYNIYTSNNVFLISCYCGSNENKFTKLNKLEDVVALSGNDLFIYFYLKSGLLMRSSIIKLSENSDNFEKFIDFSQYFKMNGTSISKLITRDDNILCLFENGRLFTVDLLLNSGKNIKQIDTTVLDAQIVDVDSGNEHFILLTDKGNVYTWGNGRRCQLGHGDLENQVQPKEVEALSGVKIIKVKAGGWHNLALSVSGDLYTWGWNDSGQLGVLEGLTEINSKTDCALSPQALTTESSSQEKAASINELNYSKAPSQASPYLVDFYEESSRVALELDVIEIACGSRHSAVVLSDYTVWTTGLNNFGQLGFDQSKIPNSPQYKKSFSLSERCQLKCGPWTTVLEV